MQFLFKNSVSFIFLILITFPSAGERTASGSVVIFLSGSQKKNNRQAVSTRVIIESVENPKSANNHPREADNKIKGKPSFDILAKFLSISFSFYLPVYS